MPERTEIMRWTRGAGWIALAASQLTLLIGFLVIYYPPKDSGGAFQIYEFTWPLKMCLVSGILALIVALFITTNRLRLLAVLSFCIAANVTMIWIHSYYWKSAVDIGKAVAGVDPYDPMVGKHVRVVSGAGGVVFFYANFSWHDAGDQAADSFVLEQIYVERNIDKYVGMRSGAPTYPSPSADNNAWPGNWLEKLGIYFWDVVKKRSPASTRIMYGITLPYWLFMLPLPIFPIAWLRRALRQRKRSRRGLCDRCGYDLQASSERCPECGLPIKKESGEDSPRASQLTP